MKTAFDNLTLSLDRDSEAPLFRQISEGIAGCVRAGELKDGERLPAIRKLAEELGVNRTTVQMAYRALESAGWATTRIGSGTRIQTSAPQEAGLAKLDNQDERARPVREESPSRPQVEPGAWVPRFSTSTQAAYAHLVASAEATQADGGASGELALDQAIDFSRLMPDESLFPVGAFRDSLNGAFDEHGSELLSYGPMRGHKPLREELARRISAQHREGLGKSAPARGSQAARGEHVVRADQVLITSGAQQGIELCLRCFAGAGDSVLIGSPTYHQLFGMLRALDLRGQAITSGSGPGDGFEASELGVAVQRNSARLIYAMPTFHNPTGRTWSEAARRDFLEQSQGFAGPVIEDDFEQDLRFEGRSPATLRALAIERGEGDRVVSLGTFSKGLFPGIRVGWVCASEAIIERLSAIKRYSDLSSGLALQAALHGFLEAGHYEEHLDRVRQRLRERHECMQSALAKHLGDLATWTRPEGGYTLWVEFSPGLNTQKLAQLCRARGVLITPGRIFIADRGSSSGMRLTVARVGAERIDEGVRQIAEAAAELRSHPTTSPSVFV